VSGPRLLIIDGHHRGQRVGIGDNRPMVSLIVGPSADGVGGVETQDYHRVVLAANTFEEGSQHVSVEVWSVLPQPSPGYILAQVHALALEAAP